MKKFAMILMALAISVPAFAQNLPFVGKRVFTFEYDKDLETITIAKNGQVKITTSKTHWLGANQVLYQGKYRTQMPINEIDGKISGYYQIKGKQICLYEYSGELSDTGCTELAR